MTTLNGTRAPDEILGGAADDQLSGFGGNDTLLGYGGADLVRGGVGDDSLAAYSFIADDTEADTVYGQHGDDFLVVGNGDTADGGEGDDTIRVSGSGPFSLSGGPGYDTLQLEGNISGSTVAGFERLEASTSAYGSLLTATQLDSFDVVGGAPGQRSVYLNLTAGGTATFGFDPALISANVRGTTSSETLTLAEGTTTALYYGGGQGNDSVTGGDGHDRLSGGTGSDSLRGGAGDDNLFANFRWAHDSDADWLFGASGNDFLRAGANDSAYGGTGHDTLIADQTAELHGDAGDDSSLRRRTMTPSTVAPASTP